MGGREDDEEGEAQGWSEAGALGDGKRARPGYENLIAWQKGLALVIAVYRETESWPQTELYGLTSQVQRAAVAIPSNLAEGYGRSGPREFAHHTSIAYGSLCEVETQLRIASELGYLTPAATQRLKSLANDVRRVTLGLFRSLNDRADGGSRT